MKFDMRKIRLNTAEQEVYAGFEQIDKLKSQDTVMFLISTLLNAFIFYSGLPVLLCALFLAVNTTAFFLCLRMNRKECVRIAERILEIAQKEVEGDADGKEKVRLLLDRIADKMSKGELK